MNFFVYLLFSEERKKTYVGFSSNIDKRIKEHAEGKVRTTRNFRNFSWQILEKTNNIILARQAEKYWKSAAGRKKIKEILKNG